MLAAFASPLLFAAAMAHATQFLYVSSYAGTLTTLDLSKTCSKGCGNATTTTRVPLLRTVSSTNGCAGSPSWLTLDAAKSVLYCVDEGLNSGNGSLSSFATSAHGDLKRLDKVKTLGGPVSGVLYGHGRKGLAVAHYSPGALTTWDISDPTSLSLIRSEQYTIAHHGPVSERQDASHAHQTFLDPTGSFILVPDLGADKIHVYAVPKSTADLKLKRLSPISVKPGSGPRHITFASRDGKTFMYLVTELANTIIGYQVSYASASIQFRKLFTIGTHGAKKAVPKGAAAAEIAVSPDAKYLIVSSRNESALSIPNFDPKNSTRIVSDSLINFSIDAKSGSLTRIQQVASGGRFPRQFSINRAGTLLAVGQQTDGRVVLINRDVDSGRLGSFAAYANVAGAITSVVFDERAS